MPRAKDDGTAQGSYGAAWLVDVYPGPSHHPLRAAFSAISNKAYVTGMDPGMGQSGPGPGPFWQVDHANSVYFGAISANFPPISKLSSLFFANPASGLV